MLSVLVGHHSERHHRVAIARSHAAMDQSVAEGNKAEYYRKKAEAAANNNAIYTEDDNAVEKLQQKIAELEKSQKTMVEANKIIRSKKLSQEQKIEELQSKAGVSLETAKNLFIPNCYGHIGFESFQLTNNGATLRTAKQRLERIKSLKSQENKEYIVNGIRVVENYADDRFQIFFAYKPDKEIRVRLHNAVYRYSSNNQSWQCRIKRYYIERGKEILESLTAPQTE